MMRGLSLVSLSTTRGRGGSPFGAASQWVYGLLEAMHMKLIRVAIIFAAGVYFGSRADNGGRVDVVVDSVQEVIAQLHTMRR